METARSVAFDPRATADERYDAQVELTKAHAPRNLSDLLLPPSELQPIIDHIRNDLEDQAISKALSKPNIIPFPSTAIRDKKPGMQSVYLDDMQVQVQGDWYEKPGNFSFDMQRQMVAETPVLNSVIMTRQRQVQRFCRPQSGGKGPGFRIGLRDSDGRLDAEDQKAVQLLQGFFMNCGWEKKARARMRLRRDDFGSFMAKLTRETLTLDSMPIETEFKRDRSLGLDGMYAVDGSTIRLCTEEGYRGDDEIYALQVVQGNIRAAYSYDDLIYVPRNPLADVNSGGYGLSETELLIRVVTGFLNAFTYNTKYFDSNAIPKGMLHLSGNFTESDVAGFKRQWNAMVRGINNAWTLPVMMSKDQESKASFENFGVEVNEMMFGKWISFLVSMICAIYGMAPDEINFESFSTGTSSLSGNDTEEKIANSKDKGLRPLLAYYENIFSEYVVSEYGDKFQFEFTGLDEEDSKMVEERRKLNMTWNEMRALDDLPPIDGKVGEAPLNPVLMAPWQQENMPQEQDFGQPGQPAPGEDQGDGSAGGPDFGDPGAENNSGADFGAGGEGDGQPASPEEIAKAFGLPVFKVQP